LDSASRAPRKRCQTLGCFATPELGFSSSLSGESTRRGAGQGRLFACPQMWHNPHAFNKPSASRVANTSRHGCDLSNADDCLRYKTQHSHLVVDVNVGDLRGGRAHRARDDCMSGRGEARSNIARAPTTNEGPSNDVQGRQGNRQPLTVMASCCMRVGVCAQGMLLPASNAPS
jgi:hypothetical protein